MSSHRTLCLVLPLALAASSCTLAEELAPVQLTQHDTTRDSGAIGRDEWRAYGPYEVAAGGELQALLTLTAGDADLYARVGAAPTWGVFDCRPYLGGTRAEECRFEGPATVYLAVAGYAWSSDYELAVAVAGGDDVEPTCGNATLDEGEACDGKPIECSALDPAWKYGSAPCLADCSGWDEGACNVGQDQHFSDWGTLPAGRWRHFGPFNTLPGEVRAVIGGTDLGGTGDVDLYVRRARPAMADTFDCRSNGAASIESCVLEGPGLFYVSVYGYAASSDFTIDVSYTANYTTPQPAVNRAAGNVAADEWQLHGPYFHGAGEVAIIMAGSDDADLYVRAGAAPTTSAYACRPYSSGSDEVCYLSFDGPGELWVGVRGWATSSYYELVSVYAAE